MNGVTVPFKNTEIAWSTDKDVKFQNPDDAANYFASRPRPPNWQQDAWHLDQNNTDNNGFKNVDFIVWMRTAAMPTFSKLYRNGSGTFQKGLPKGNYVLDITYRFGGKRRIGKDRKENVEKTNVERQNRPPM